jgi:hypothetical protein
VVDDELEIFEVDGLTLGELDAKQVDVVGGDGGFRSNEPSKHLEEKEVANPPSRSANCQYFLH